MDYLVLITISTCFKKGKNIMNETQQTNAIIALTSSEIDSLKQGYIVTTAKGESVKLINGVPTLLKAKQGKLPYKSCTIPHPQTADCLNLSSTDMEALFNQHGTATIYRSSGAKNGEKVLSLKEQAEKGLAREIVVTISPIDGNYNNRNYDNWRVVEFKEMNNTKQFESKGTCNIILASPTNFVKF